MLIALSLLFPMVIQFACTIHCTRISRRCTCVFIRFLFPIFFFVFLSFCLLLFCFFFSLLLNAVCYVSPDSVFGLTACHHHFVCACALAKLQSHISSITWSLTIFDVYLVWVFVSLCILHSVAWFVSMWLERERQRSCNNLTLNAIMMLL